MFFVETFEHSSYFRCDNGMKREKEKVKSVTESGEYFAKRNSLANSLLCLVFNMKIFSRIQNRMSRKNSTSPTTD